MELPQRYGHYVLLERIAVGGMGEIFRASYAGLAGFERPCAIKRILPHLSDDPEFVDRLISEAMIAVQLSHANIVQIYELGKIENEYFIAMEWVDGPDLSTLQVRAKAKDIAWPLPLAIHVVHEIARAVDHAHRKTDADGKDLQIVHRDISPQNVMLTIDGAVKLGDFGIARAGGIARRFVTGMGAVLGKRRYMSPEQRRGENVDARTDVYALGALLYEGVTGGSPEPDGPIPPMSTLAKDVTPELDALCAKALAQDPKDRLASAADLVEGLERVFVRMASQPGAIRDPGPELGRFVRKICPPGEKLPQKRSLTSRIRAAMRPGAQSRAALTETPARTAAEGNGTTPSAPSVIASLEIPHGADGVTLVRSAVIPAAPIGPDTKAATVANVPGSPAPAVLPGAPSTMPTLTAQRPPAEDETAIDSRAEDAQAIASAETDLGPGFGSSDSGPGLEEAQETGSGPRAASGGTETVPVAPRARGSGLTPVENSDLSRPSRKSSPVAETMIQPMPDLVRASRGPATESTIAPEEAAALPRSVETVFAPLAATGDPPRNVRPPPAPETMTIPPDLARPSSRSVNAVEVRRPPAVSRVRPELDDDRTRGDALFPSQPPRSPVPLVAGLGVVGLAMLVLIAWAAGLFASNPETTAVATPFAAASPPPTRVPTRRPPDRTPTPRPATPTPERTPSRTPTPTPVKTRIAVVATPKPTPKAATFGTLEVNAKPWAKVSLDGKVIGQTPIKGYRIASGSYRLVLEHPTHGRVERQIRVQADETERVIVDFKNLPGEPGPGSP